MIKISKSSPSLADDSHPSLGNALEGTMNHSKIDVKICVYNIFFNRSFLVSNSSIELDIACYNARPGSRGSDRRRATT